MLAPEIIEMIGLSGGLLILAAWAFETIEAVKKHKSLIDLKFSFVSLVGSAMLAAYAATQGFQIFFWVNSIISIIIVFEIVYSIHVKKVHRRR